MLKALTIGIDVDLIKKLKVKSAEEGIGMRILVEDAIKKIVDV